MAPGWLLGLAAMTGRGSARLGAPPARVLRLLGRQCLVRLARAQPQPPPMHFPLPQFHRPVGGAGRDHSRAAQKAGAAMDSVESGLAPRAIALEASGHFDAPGIGIRIIGDSGPGQADRDSDKLSVPRPQFRWRAPMASVAWLPLDGGIAAGRTVRQSARRQSIHINPVFTSPASLSITGSRHQSVRRKSRRMPTARAKRGTNAADHKTGRSQKFVALLRLPPAC